MAFTLIQAASSLFPVNTDGSPGPALTLPTGITLAANRIPRFAKFKNYIVVVNTPTKPISVDTFGTVRPLTPATPNDAVVLTATGSGTLTGNYLAEVTFVIKDAVGNDIAESDFSAIMASSVATSSQQLNAVIDTSLETTVNARRLYRTTAGPGASYFPWLDVPDNSTTSITDGTTDAALGLVAKPVRGTAPDLTLIAEWSGRLWGVPRDSIDNLRWTEAGTMFAWGSSNSLPIPHLGEDRFGITALAPRRNGLGVGRRDNLLQVQGTTTADFRPVNISENCGILSQESVVIWRDAVYFLWDDGVYRWDDSGIECISDTANVRSWFTTDDYFNRGMFSQSFAGFDVFTQTYRLFLCSAGSTTFNSWVEYSLKTGKFYGPHSTKAFTPSSCVTVRGSLDKPFLMIGSLEGFLSQDVQTRADWIISPIEMDVIMAAHECGAPDIEKYFGEMSIHTEKEPAGTLDVTATVGNLDETFTVDQTHDLTIPRERLFRLGEGKFCSLRFRNNELNQNVSIYGYSIPAHITARR